RRRGAMVIETRHEVVYISGSISTDLWPAIRTTASLVAESFPDRVVIDFSEVQWISRSGEITLAAALEEIEQNQLPFVLVNLSSEMLDLLPVSVSIRIKDMSESRRMVEAIGSETWWNRLWGTA